MFSYNYLENFITIKLSENYPHRLKFYRIIVRAKPVNFFVHQKPSTSVNDVDSWLLR